MKKLKYIIGSLCLLAMSLWSCMDDLGNYDYDFDSVSELKIDTAGMDRSFFYSTNWNIGDTIRTELKVKYNKPENLIYRWLIMDNNYQAETVGDSKVYPPADTICKTLDLEYIVSLKAGNHYQLWLMVKDTVSGVCDYMKMINYLGIPEAGEIKGVYCLQEKDGRIDIDIFGTPLALIFSYGGSNEFHVKDYWSTMHADHPLTGNAKSIYYSTTGKWYYIFTEQEGLRCSPSNLIIMDTWDEMFYSAPAYAPTAVMCANNCDFLINNGKLHCLYIDVAGDRKFPTSLSGSYELSPFLASQTIASWRPVEGAIGAYQVVYDQLQNGFRPFFNRSSSLSKFSEADPEAVFDVNHMQGELVYTATVNGGETMAVMKREGSYWMDVACFYNVVDNGKLARHSHSLEGCTDIDKASYFLATTGGPALFYAVENILYSYSYSTGQTESVKLWSSNDPNDEITCMQINPSGGYPTAQRILWVAVWNKQTKEGRIVEFEYNSETGKIEDQWGPMFGITEPSPRIFDGFGKIISITYTI